ncbi:MAG: class II D-tagatose-bisphosphate aldolase, non-catalytic subunit [Betaproteobacteria bacterium]|uniref:class II D-tagatose-bisphosphate aldolase non-catalytic subunit n=1 Tax=Candidatus Nitrotoga sp. HW29 TaxID=2886963 RepID=UPI001EF1DEAC|nr:class II D-tagatose-bisphosphate aldolase, non-catalytic subunit [Candidatus Nitrotoga sp. HW29]MCE9551695.1 class II D-tagatose-bisphosphate aldolase, non-catalytic subunit [Betaproteobacteria bacterium]CAH1906335.1 Tagatose-6-phosphate kinase [Candidatus Nitrotoga sp. HW29]
MIQHRLRNIIERRRCTLLGVGPMSVNCVDATIELANEYEVPIMIIASRRQIDSEDFGGGYVNNWTTEEFARYVTDKDKKGNILLARDHGGPWQNTREKDQNLGLRRAMDSAKVSYRADIAAGFQIIHIDPSIDIHGVPDVDEVLDRLFDLYEYCWTQAANKHQEVIFEVGTEEQSGSTNTQEVLDYTLNAISKFCQSNRINPPAFVVVQCGTRVMEMRNVGSFDSPVRVVNEIPAEIQLPKMLEICNRHGVFMKEHNADYLSDEALQWHPRLGIHAANVAPEFGVAESTALVGILERNGLANLAEKFLALAYRSHKWDKWMLEGTRATDRERALIAGHYVFSTPECQEIRAAAIQALAVMQIDLDDYLKAQVKQSILRYLRSFRLAL